MNRVAISLGIGLVVVGVLLAGCRSAVARKFLYFPTHRPGHNGLSPWIDHGKKIGFARLVAEPGNVWLLLHGNGGQAADRVYALPRFSENDAIFILEYPGYGERAGVPSRASFTDAAESAYRWLRENYPRVPVCVAAESIGSGTACFLASGAQPPDKVVLVVPFDRLSLVAKEKVPSFLVSFLLRDDWDNVRALASYRGPIEVFGAERDSVIPVSHAKALAAAIPRAKFTLLSGDHNDWSYSERVAFRNP